MADPAPKPKDYARRLFKGSAIVFAAFIASEIIGIFLRMFLARSLTVAEYGLFYAVLAFVSLFSLFQGLGLSAALGKYIPEFTVRKRFPEIKSSIAFAMLVQAVLAFTTSAVLFILSDHIALAVFGTLNASLPLRILSIWFFVEGFRGIVLSTIQGFQNMGVYSLLSFSHIMLFFFSAVLFVSILSLSLNGVAIAYLLATVLICLFGIAFCIRRYSHVFREKISITKPLRKKLLMFGLPLFVAGFGSLIINYTDTITITVFRTMPEVGYYQAAQPTARILWYFPMALTAVLFPMISELWARQKQKLLGQALHFLTKFSFVILIPAALVFIAFPDIVIDRLFGPGYLAGAAALQILSATAIAYVLCGILSSVIGGIGRPMIVTKIIAVMALFNLVCDLALVGPCGIEGVAMATLGAWFLGLVLFFYYSRKFIKFGMPYLSILKTAVGGVLTLLLIFDLKSILTLPPWPEAFVVVILGMLFYVAWILATKAITKDDLRLITRIVSMPRRLAKLIEKLGRK